jgi:outer membrane protein
MTKRLFLFLLLPLLLSAKDDIYIGAGPYFQTQPYKEADPVVLGTPVIFFDNSLFYVRWTRLGMYFLGHSGEEESWGLSLTAQPQILGYYESPALTQFGDRDSTPILQGMEERESGWEGGLAAAYSRGNFFAEFVLLQDVADQSNGTKLRLELGHSFKTGRWYFVPSVLAVWLSQPFANYYFGVGNDEEDLVIGRPAYRSGAALNFAAQAYIKYDLAEHWHLLANLRADRFDDTVFESPIVSRRMMYSGMISLLYSFNLFGEEKAVLNPPEKR